MDRVVITLRDLRRIAAVLSPDDHPSDDFVAVWRRVTNWHIDIVVTQLVWDTLGRAAPLGDALDVLTEDGSLRDRLWAAAVCGPLDLVFWPYENEPYWPEASWGIFDDMTPSWTMRRAYDGVVKYNSCPRLLSDMNQVALLTPVPSGSIFIRSRLAPYVFVLRRHGLVDRNERVPVPNRHHSIGWCTSLSETDWRFPGGPAPESLRCEIGL